MSKSLLVAEHGERRGQALIRLSFFVNSLHLSARSPVNEAVCHLAQYPERTWNTQSSQVSEQWSQRLWSNLLRFAINVRLLCDKLGPLCLVAEAAEPIGNKLYHKSLDTCTEFPSTHLGSAYLLWKRNNMLPSRVESTVAKLSQGDGIGSLLNSEKGWTGAKKSTSPCK